jgi:hypothetical protein
MFFIRPSWTVVDLVTVGETNGLLRFLTTPLVGGGVSGAIVTAIVGAIMNSMKKA